MNVRDVCNWLLVASESEINAVRKACEVGLALNGTTATQHSTPKRCAMWTPTEEAALLDYVKDLSRDENWGSVAMKDREMIAKRLGRSVSGCRDHWRKLKGLRD